MAKEVVMFSDYDNDLFRIYLREVRSFPRLCKESERKLGERRLFHDDKKAREILIQHNLRLVVMIARKYIHLNVPVLDLIQEGTLGLISAVDTFDPRLGGLANHAIRKIKRQIGRAIQGVVHLPTDTQEELAHLIKASKRLPNQMDSEAGLLAIESGMTVAKVKELQGALRAFSVESLHNVVVTDDDECEKISIMPSLTAAPPDVLAFASQMMAKLATKWRVKVGRVEARQGKPHAKVFKTYFSNVTYSDRGITKEKREKLFGISAQALNVRIKKSCNSMIRSVDSVRHYVQVKQNLNEFMEAHR